jgi:hypothetical protein
MGEGKAGDEVDKLEEADHEAADANRIASEGRRWTASRPKPNGSAGHAAVSIKSHCGAGRQRGLQARRSTPDIATGRSRKSQKLRRRGHEPLPEIAEPPAGATKTHKDTDNFLSRLNT